MTHELYDAIVIGGSAAGLSSAQALGRSLRRTLVIDAAQPRNRFAHQMHNVLGLDGTPPRELVARGRAEAEAYGVEFREATVCAVRNIDAPGAEAAAAAAADAATPGALLEVELEGGERVRARGIVLATGVTDELPAIPGLAERWGTSVLHCPYCHGWEVRGQRLAVITTSPMGLHQAKLIRQWSDHVTVFTAGLVDETGASVLDADTERLLRSRGVQLVAEPVVEAIGVGAQLTAVRTADGREYPLDAAFTAGTLRPHDGFVAHLDLARTDTIVGSFLEVDMMQRTSHPRIWAAGNVTNPMATVPASMATGMMAGAAVNAILVDEDYALAAAEIAQ